MVDAELVNAGVRPKILHGTQLLSVFAVIASLLSAFIRTDVEAGDEVVVYMSRASPMVAHLLTVDVCTVCGTCDDGGDETMLCCANCGHSFHYYCVGMRQRPLDCDSSWRCLACKCCEVCQSSAHETSMLVCEKCDRGYHTFCLYPVLPFIPKGEWLCPQHCCCRSCGARHAGDQPEHVWHEDGTLCHKCKDWIRQGHQCPACLRAYDPRNWDSERMVGCDCGKWVHCGCDGITEKLYEALLMEKWKDEKYLCVDCRSKYDLPQLQSAELLALVDANVIPPQPQPSPLPSLPVVAVLPVTPRSTALEVSGSLEKLLFLCCALMFVPARCFRLCASCVRSLRRSWRRLGVCCRFRVGSTAGCTAVVCCGRVTSCCARTASAASWQRCSVRVSPCAIIATGLARRCGVARAAACLRITCPAP